MGTYEQLKNVIKDNIKDNDTQEITGDLLQSVLINVVSTIGANQTFAGVAKKGTNPGSPDQNVFYIAVEKGTYTYFGGLQINTPMAVIKSSGGKWVKEEIPVGGSDNAYPTAEFNSQLEADTPVEDPAGLVITGNKTNVYFHKGLAAFVIKDSSGKYYTEWGNSDEWNSGTKAKQNTYFLDASGAQYTFNGSVLKPTGAGGGSSLTGETWETAEFAGTSDAVPDLVSTQLGSAEPSDVYYMTKNKVFAVKKDSKYYVNFTNTSKWNTLVDGTLKAKEQAYFVNITNGLQYAFNGAELRPTGQDITAWETAKFNSVLDGSENVPFGMSFEGAVTTDMIYLSNKYSMFFVKDVGGQLYNNWEGVGAYNVDDNDPFNTLKKKAKEQTYFIASNGTQYIFDGEFKPTGAGGTGGGIPEAPADGKTYGRKDKAWVEVTSGSAGEQQLPQIELSNIDEAIVPGAYRVKKQENATTYEILLVTSYFTASEGMTYTQYKFEEKGSAKYRTKTGSGGWSGWSSLSGGGTATGGVKEITPSELDTTVAGGVYMVKSSTQIVMMQISVSTIDSNVYVTQYLFESDGAVKRRTKKNTGSWSSWEYHKQEAGDSEKHTMSQKAITNLVRQVQMPVEFNSFITEQITIEIYGSPGTGTKDNMFYYNYGSFHKFVMLHTDGKYYDQFNGQENYMADFNNPKTNTRFVDITGENYYYNGSELVSLGFAKPIEYIKGKYDDADSFVDIAKKLWAAPLFFAKIEVKKSEGSYVQVCFIGKLIKDDTSDVLPALLMGIGVDGNIYRMIGLGEDRVEIEDATTAFIY